MKSYAFVLVAFLALIAPAASQNCGLCETVVTLIETWVENNATEQQIEQYLNSVCALFPQYSAVCDQIVDQGLAQVIHWLQNNESPTQVCTQLGMCPGKVIQPKFHSKFMIPQTKVNKIKHGECDACEEVISTIENWLANTEEEQEVIQAIEVVCTYMPDWTSTCDAIIAAGVPQVIEWIVTYENSTIVCGQLGLCTPVAVPKVAPAPAKPQDNCDDCVSLVGYIENWVENNATEAEIVQYLDTVCALIPQYQDVCDLIVATEVPAIIQYLQQNQPPSVVCQEIGICTSRAPVTPTKYAIKV